MPVPPLSAPRALSLALALIAMALIAAPAAAAGSDARGDLILGGTAAPDVPWEALVYIEGKTGPQASGGRCTGAVVGERWVMTAAHCLTQTDGPKTGELLDEIFTLIVTGQSDVSLIAELEQKGDQATADRVAQELNPALGEAYFVSDSWNPALSLFLADIALIRLDRAVAPELGIPPARADQQGAFAAGRRGVVSGWGVTETGAISSILRDALAPLRPPEDCADLAPFGFTSNAMLCSGEEGPPPQGTCKGDSGGALSAPAASGAPIAGGITSFGPPDCTLQPAAFTRVSAFSEFISTIMRNDPEAPVTEPEVDAVTITPGANGVAAVDATLDANGAATNLEIDFIPQRPAAPLLRGGRGGSSTVTRDVALTVEGLAPGVSYEWRSFASSVLARSVGPTGQISVPGDVRPLDVSPESTRCLPLETRSQNGGSGAIDLNRRQLAINQRIGQAALKRLNAIEDWLNAGITGADICGGSLGGRTLSGIDLGLAGAGPTAPAPSPREIQIEPLSPIDLDRFTVSKSQLRTNQRIYQAAVRRARALNQRINGRLTGGDIRDGELGWEALPPGALMTRFGPGEVMPASTTAVAARTSEPDGNLRASATQLLINQRIAQAAVRQANLLRAEIGAGLTAKNFARESISARDFAAPIAGRLLTAGS